MSGHAIRILGIDPGLRRTGWGLVASQGSRLSFLGCGIIRPATDLPLGDRLAVIHLELSKIVADSAPDEVAVEKTFVNKDAEATLKLGHARGVAMLVPAQAGLTIGEYAPNAVKKAVVGAGHADKKQIRLMISMLLPQSKVGSDDEADALAIAICHAHHRVARARVEALSA
ncbi:crossover junction endodeoxyribonuclease RuvC [Tepidamorphus sp. 3E244]|uniref:crossover junction endodeoxyribonuclease RuvC n=1 Tax=Tepidamorphus sp. 3E244 TaxID=3385498 RepID=UPI0038FC7270